MEQRSTVFGAEAARYDRTRPGYPVELIESLIPRTAMRVLDVGCGTGIASRLFAERSCIVLGVEPDARMAAIAEAHGIAVEVAGFADWEPNGRHFDIVVSAQAWHWIDPVAGPKCARSAMLPGATLAILWNAPRHDAVVEAAFDDIYERIRLPDGSRCSPPGALADSADRFIAGIEAAGGFEAATEAVHTWAQRYSAEEWVDLLPTHSDHRLLPAPDLRQLLDATAAAIDDVGGFIEVGYDAHLIVATAR